MGNFTTGHRPLLLNSSGRVVGNVDLDGKERLLSAPVTVAHSCVLIGDSLTEQCGGPGTTEARRFANYGYITHLIGMLRGGLHVVSNLGVTGQTTQTLAARIESEVLAVEAGIVIWLVSGNGIANGATGIEEIGVINGILQTLTLAGRLVVVGTIPPRAASGTGSFSTAAMLQYVEQVNRFLSAYARSNPMVMVADTHGALTDYATGVPASGVFRDTPAIHPGPLGAYLIAEAFFEVLDGKLTSVQPLAHLGSPYNLVSTALSSWTVNDTGGTTTRTESFTATGSDGRADWWETDISAMSAAGATRQAFHATIASGWSVGDVVQGICEYELDSATDLRALNLQIRQTGGVATNVESQSEFNASSGITLPSARQLRRGLMVTPRFAIVTGTTAIQPFLRVVAQSSSSVAKVRFRKPAVINLTLAGF